MLMFLRLGYMFFRNLVFFVFCSAVTNWCEHSMTGYRVQWVRW